MTNDGVVQTESANQESSSWTSRRQAWRTATLVLAFALLVLWSTPNRVFALEAKSSVLNSDKEVPQVEILNRWDPPDVPETVLPVPGEILLSKTVTPSFNTEALVSVSIRWWPKNYASTFGDRVAFVEINGSFKEPLLMADSSPSNLTQYSTRGTYRVKMLANSSYTIKVHFGGCCTLYGQNFMVGAGSRLDIVY